MLNYNRIIKAYRFLGSQVIKYLILGCLTGLGLFAVELCFAFGLQAFLLAIGVLDRQMATIPSWMPSQNLVSVLMVVGGVSLIKGVLQWVQMVSVNEAYEGFRFMLKSRILNWAYNSRSVSTAYFVNLFGEKATMASQVINQAQTIATILPASVLLWFGLLKIAFLPTVIATAMLAALALSMKFLDQKIGQFGIARVSIYSGVNNSVLRDIKNLLLMQIYGTQAREESKAINNLARYLGFEMKYVKLLGVKYIAPQVLGIFLICMITLTMRGSAQLKSSLLITYFYLFVRFVQNFAEATKQASTLAYHWPQFTYMASWWRENFYEVELNQEKNNPIVLDESPLTSPVGWSLQNISYHYPKTEKNIFENFNLSITSCQMLVVTGQSGAGKSTLLGLLLGNLTPDSGAISLVLTDGKQVPIDQLRSRLLSTLGYVGPESFMVEGTLLENLCYGLRFNPTKSDLEEALNLAECQFVHDLPAGLDHIMTEQGEGLSAGQKQRLSLARALLRKPKVLILDEATSNLDAETEARLVETFAFLKKKMTIVAVTHREQLLKIADHHCKL